MSQLRIFRLTPAEAEEIIPLFHHLLDEVARERKYLAMTQAPSREKVRQFVNSSLQAGGIHLFAQDTDDLIGWCDAVPLTIPEFRHTLRLGMGIRREYRGRGIGARLLNGTIEGAQENSQFSRIELEVYETNRPAVRLYEKAGFTTEGIKKKARLLDGQYDDIRMMARFLV